MEDLRPKIPSLAASLDHGAPIALDKGTLRVGFLSGSFNADAVSKQTDLLLELLRKRLGNELLHVLIEAQGEVRDSPYQRRQAREEEMRRQKEEDLRQHPLVVGITKELDGTLKGVKVYNMERNHE